MSYLDELQRKMGQTIGSLGLLPLQEDFLRSRWLEQIVWMEGRCGWNQKWYYRLRVAAIVGGILVPALVGWRPAGEAAGTALAALASAVSLLVAISLAVEGFFRFGERWRHYRRTAETLKAEGWQFFQLAGPYASFGGHQQAHPRFAERVEEILQQDLETFVTKVAIDKDGKDAPKQG